ncbi:DNA cytosine methyltransferase [Ancylobacter sonchi]|uniref:DNA cytosine methyltransferase n=1 Tax=Ancylobacter sonchi TaxID=1937790 RepID=UPI001BD5CDCA|nr:DNA cytosine methyltransferase [Ancylobacter sonchi]MBS7532073.1 DNA cytosine methyltransferase [Ancylobacter sonchi]
MSDVEIRHFHICCGLGGGAKGFNRGRARVGMMNARFRCIGGVDSDAAAIRDFTRAAGVQGTVLNLFSTEQYIDFHDRPPPADWREATTDDMRRAAHGERPHIVFASFPCKGFSGLLSETKSLTKKYKALNSLSFRGLWLALEAWKDDPPEFFIFENVPRIATRGRHFVDQLIALLRSYGYVVAETTHDCGVIGGLGQSRKRFLMVARHAKKVPPFLYEPPKRRLRGVGEILEKLPLPGDEERGGPMHRIPSLQWKTWVRLAFVEAGSDWRSLNRLAIADGVLRDYGIAPDTGWQAGVLGVQPWNRHSGTVTGRGSPTNGTFAVADPRAPDGALQYGNFGVRDWALPTGAVINVKSPGQGGFAVSDPRLEGTPRFNNTFRIVGFGDHSPAVAGPGGPAGGLAVADPRPSDRDDYKQTKYRVTRMDEASGVVISASTTGNGAFAVADPRTGWPDAAHQNKMAVQDWDDPSKAVIGSDRVGSGALCVADPRPGFGPSTHHNILQVHQWEEPGKTVTVGTHPSGGALCVADPRPAALSREDRTEYLTGGHYGVTGWDQSSGAVPAFAKNNNGNWSVADPREPETALAAIEALPEASTNLVAIIRALDGTWHRPFTTLELAALQSLVDPETLFTLEGRSDSAWRERIGNAVPPDAAAAIASVMGRTLLLAWAGESFMLSADPIWVQPLTVALSVDIPNIEGELS